MKIRLPKARRYRILMYVVSAVLVAYAIDLSWIRIWRHVSIGKDTTHITTPLNANGLPDYVAYLNERLSAGITPANNAAVPYFEVFDSLPPQASGEIYKKLSIPQARQGLLKGLGGFESYMMQKHPDPTGDPIVYSDEGDLVRTHPWAAAEHPEVAAWLAENDTILNSLPAITARSRWYVPLVAPPGTPMTGVMIPSFSPSRGLAVLAITRAMRSAHDGHFAEAEADLLACHRLARLHAQGWSLIEGLVALGIDNDALRGDAAIAPLLKADELAKFTADLNALPPYPTLTAQMEGERCVVLDTLICALRNPVPSKEAGEEYEPMYNRVYDDGPWMEATRRFVEHHRPPNANAGLRLINSMLDYHVTVAEAPTVRQREDMLKTMEAEMRRLDIAYQSMFADPAERVAVNTLLWGKAFQLYDMHAQRASLTRVAVALASYKVANGVYPNSLGALAPQHIAEVPLDLFSEQPLHYQKTATGFLLYSVGPNLKDDGGQPYDSQHHLEDDIMIREGLAERVLKK